MLEVKRGHCACSHRLAHSSLPSPWTSLPQLSRTTLERLPPTVKSNERKRFPSKTWPPFPPSGLPNLEANTMCLCSSGVQASACQLSIWPLTGRSPADAFHRPRSHPSPAHFVPPAASASVLATPARPGLAGRWAGGFFLVPPSLPLLAAPATPGQHCLC